MNWSEPKPPIKNVSWYDHIDCETPLGKCIIEWKGWKKSDSFSVFIGEEYVGEGFELKEAKKLAIVSFEDSP